MTQDSQVFSLNIEDDIALVTIDVKGDSQNTLKEAFAPQLHELLADIKNQTGIKAVVVCSGKPDSFIAGADISMLKNAKTEADVEKIVELGHSAFDALENSSLPIVAAIHGPCLGGGLEFALACHARVASVDSQTVFGLPEVQLGLLPAGGGTQRLPRQIGIAQALDLMLTGKKVKAKKALKLGLIDEVVPATILVNAAKKKALELASKGDFSPRLHRESGHWYDALTSFSGIQKLALEDNSYGRSILFDQARKKTKAKTLGNYPAPEKIISCIEAGVEHGMKHGLAEEKKNFAQLVMSPEAAQLMNIFFATTALKKDSGVEGDVKARAIDNVVVLGGGLMGAGISYVSIEKAGKTVRIKDIDDKGVAGALKYSHKILEQRAKRKSITKAQAAKTFSKLTGCTDYSGMKKADIFIEAVFEDLALKHQMIKDIEEHGNKDAIIASNTSSIPIAEIAKAANNPENVIGLHYFSPVEKMPLLEIVVTPQTSPEVIATGVELGKQQGKTVIVVNDGPGFYTSRILSPYLNEAGHLVAEGVAIDDIDAALKQFGFPVGPLTLIDEVGIDVGSKIAPILVEAFGDRMRPPSLFEKILADGRLGKKNGKGLYLHDGKSKEKAVDESIYRLIGVFPSKRTTKQEIAERCAFLMVNEAFHCLEEGIIRSPRDGDIGAIFGLGFPPFLGGPFRFVESMGLAEFKEKLSYYQNQHGERFKPANILDDLINGKKRLFEDD